MKGKKFLMVMLGLAIFISLAFVSGIESISSPKGAADPAEYDGCLTFGDANYNGIDYNLGNEPFDQLFSFYRNDQLDPSYPNPPFDPSITGYGDYDHADYPFNGGTEIVDLVDGHLNILKSEATENGYHEGYNFPDSPASSTHSIEFWWAWETI